MFCAAMNPDDTDNTGLIVGIVVAVVVVIGVVIIVIVAFFYYKKKKGELICIYDTMFYSLYLCFYA